MLSGRLSSGGLCLIYYYDIKLILRSLYSADDNDYREERPDFSTETATTFIYNPARSQSIEKQRERLPIFRCRQHLLYLLERHQTLVLVGETGSGKSTQVPQYLLESGWACDGTKVAVTQPRRIAATSLAVRVAEETATVVGRSPLSNISPLLLPNL